MGQWAKPSWKSAGSGVCWLRWLWPISWGQAQTGSGGQWKCDPPQGPALASQDRHSEAGQTRSLKTTQIHFVNVLEAGNLKSWGWWGCSSSKNSRGSCLVSSSLWRCAGHQQAGAPWLEGVSPPHHTAWPLCLCPLTDFLFIRTPVLLL